MESILSVIANIFTILGITIINATKNLNKFKNKKTFLFGVLLICLYAYRQKSITVTKVTLSDDSLILSTDETHTLIATVLYSDTSTNNDVLWNSSNNSIVSVDPNGFVTALADGNATIIVQAARNNTTKIAECTVTIKTPPSGYSISVHQLTVDSYAYVYVKPYDTDIT